jgi:protein dithiol oxidoreductase (disulfide-forming)
MERREFSKRAVTTLCAGMALPLAVPGAMAQARKPDAGADYLVLERRAPVEAQAPRIEVVEFFWYKCPHCNAFEPALEAWIKKLPKDVALRRVPVGFRDDFVPQQRLFYALEAMDKLEQIHGKVFTAIHGEKKSLDKVDQIADWVAAQGVDKAKFLENYNSFSVNTKVQRATQLQNQYRVEGVPALGVAGRFYTDGTLSKNMNRALEVVNYLVGEVRAGR